MRIKQWKQWLANWLLKDVEITQNPKSVNSIPGYQIIGDGWFVNTPDTCIPPSLPPQYVPKYGLRTEAEHAAIRKRIQRSQENCSHLKGGYIRNVIKDYNLSGFTFADGSKQIKCLSCRKVWTPDSLDWKEACAMFNSTTNTWASSERYQNGKRVDPKLSAVPATAKKRAPAN